MKKFLLFLTFVLIFISYVFAQKDTNTKEIKKYNYSKVILRDFEIQQNLYEKEGKIDLENNTETAEKQKVDLPSEITIKDLSSNSKITHYLPYSTTFDDVTDWAVSGNLPQRLWQVGDQNNTSYGPPSGHSGQICAGTRLNDNYGVDNAIEYLISPEISLSGASNPRLSFWMDMESEYYFDRGYVYISKNGGYYYQIAYTDFEQNIPNSDNCWTGTLPTGDWQQVFLDLFSVTGSGLAPIISSDTIRVAFLFYSDYMVNNYPGWYIDDFEVYDLKDTTTIVTAPTTQVPSNDISSLLNSQASAFEVFKFKISDAGTSDGLPTKVNQFVIFDNASTANWITTIDGAELWTEDNIKLTDYNVSILSDRIYFTAKTSDDYYTIPNGQSKEFTLKIWLKQNGLVDNSTMSFIVPTSLHEFTNKHDGTSSEFRVVFPAQVSSNTFTIRVQATELRFIKQPSEVAYSSTVLVNQPGLWATDAYGNRDLDYNASVSLSNSGSLPMANNTATFSSGSVTFTNFMFTSGGQYVQLDATSGSLSTLLPSREIAVDVNLCTIFSETFDSYTVTNALPSNPVKWYTKTYVGSSNQWGIGTVSGANKALTIGDGSNHFVYVATDNAIKVAYCNQKIDSRGYRDLKIQIKWKCNGEVSLPNYYDFGKVVWSTDMNEFGYANEIAFYNQGVYVVGTYDLSACDDREFYIGLFWKNDNSIKNDPPFAIDEFSIMGRSQLEYNFTYRKDIFRPLVGTIIDFGSNDYADVELPVGFNFTYEGSSVNQVRVGKKGWVQLDNTFDGSVSNTLKNSAITEILAPLWDNSMTTDELSTIIYTVKSSSPTRVFSIEWRNVLLDGKRQNFQVKLYETSNIIEFWYGNVDISTSNNITIGINSAGDCSQNKLLSVLPSDVPLYSYLVENYITNQAQYITKDLVYMFNPLEMQHYYSWQDMDMVIGQTDYTTINTTASQTIASGANSSAISSKGVLAVGSGYANRVLLWTSLPETNGAAANIVLGQLDFTSTTAGISNWELDNPTNVGFSPDGNKLLVCDAGNNRVLIWNTIPTTNGQPADVVIGQLDFNSYSSGCSPSKLYYPTGILVLPDGRLIITDNGNNRVLIFNKIPETNGAEADVVIGQPDFYTNTSGSTANKLYGPWDCAYTPDGRLLISDDGNFSNGNHRVLVFNNVPKTNGATADKVIGNDDFASTPAGCSRNSFDQPSITVSVEGKLAIADFGNSRVVLYNSVPAYNNPSADFVLGQPHWGAYLQFNKGLDNGGTTTDANIRNMYLPYSINFDINGRLYVNGTQPSSGDGMHRVMVFGNKPTTSTDISVQISTTTPQVCVYNEVEYNVIVTNNGTSDAYNVYVNAQLPFDIQPTDYEAHDGTIYNQKTGYWYIPYIAAGQSAYLTFRGLVGEGEKNSSVTAYAFTLAMSQKETNYSNNASSTVVAVRNYFAPVISDFDDENIPLNSSVLVPFTVTDNDGLSDIDTYTASSSNTTLLPVNYSSNIIFGGIEPNKTVNLVPATNKYGRTQVTIIVTDKNLCYNQKSFVLSVGNFWTAGDEINPTDWFNSRNWAVDVPTSTTEAIIPSIPDGGFFPIINNTGAECYDLLIEPLASVTLSDGYNIDVTNNIYLKSDSLGTGSFVDLNFGDGLTVGNTVSVEQYVSKSKWYYVSSPLNNMPNSALTQNNCINYNGNLIYFNEAYNTDVDGDGKIDWFDGWVWPWYYNQNSDSLVPGKGYAYYWDTWNCNNILEFTGTNQKFNSGDILVTVTNQDENATLDSNSVKTRGWNLVGNPYPSAIDADLFLQWEANATTIDNTIYFWDEQGESGWALDGRDYASYNESLGGTTGSGSNSIIPDKYININQSFFVRRSNTDLIGSQIVFNNSMRNIHNSNYFKNNQQKPPKVKLSLSNSKYYNEIIIGFAQDASANYRSPKYDGYKVEGNTRFSFYSLKNNEYFVNQAIRPIENIVDTVVPIGFNSLDTGYHTLFLKFVDILNPSIKIFLIDVYADTIVDLRKNKKYVFYQNQAGRFDNRFYVHFTTNNVPVLVQDLEQQNILEDELSAISIPLQNFIDPDGDNLTISVKLPNNNPLPSFMTFDAENSVLYVVPSNDEVGLWQLQVTASDVYKASVTTPLYINVINVNDAPFVNQPIEDITMYVGQNLAFKIDNNTFIDVDQNDVLIYSVNSNASQDWFNFDNQTNTIFANPTNEAVGSYTVEVIATDLQNASASTTFMLNVLPALNIIEDNSQYKLMPNPSCGKFEILTDVAEFDYTIYDVVGNIVQKGHSNKEKTTIDISFVATGVYIIEMRMNNKTTLFPIIVNK